VLDAMLRKLHHLRQRHPQSGRSAFAGLQLLPQQLQWRLVMKPFFVLATQNPIEQEGTYPLPVAQLDRFMFMTNVGYPTFDEEYEVGRLTTSGYAANIEPLVTKQEILDLHGLVRKVELADDVIRYAMELVRRSRVRTGQAPAFVREWLSWGAGPRATQFLGIKRVKVILHLEQSATEGAKLRLLFRDLALRAACFNALEVGEGHK